MSRNAERMMELFRGLDGVHGTHGVPERDHESGSLKWAIKKTARTLRESVTVEMWDKHLEGERPLGVVPIRADHTCQWGSIDVDQYDIDIFKLVDEVVKKKLPLMPCRSKSGGLHLFLFTAQPQPAAAFQVILRDIAASLGLAGSEIFPKQTQLLSERGDAGSWMVMPYYGGTFDGKLQEQVGLKKAGGSMALPEFLRKSEELRLSTVDFEALGERRHAASRTSGKDAGPFADGPRCLQHMVSEGGIQEGGRNNALLMVGIYLKKKYPGEWAIKLDEYNQNYFMPPLTSEEVASCVNSLQKTEYDYTCKTEPMHSHCDVAVCRGRRFGVGEAGAYPIISSISKLDIPETPIWFVHIEGQSVELSTEELQSFILFQRACMIRLNRTFRMMKQSDWVVLVAEAMANVQLLPPPSDAGNQEHFKELITDFLTNQAKGQRAEDLFAGRPWEDPGLSAEDALKENQQFEGKKKQKRVEPREARHFFRLGDLMRFLEREKMRDLTRGRVTQRIKSLDGESMFLNIRGRGVNVWYVPVAAIEPAPEMDAAELVEEPI